MNANLNLFDTDIWKTLEKKPLLYVGFHEKDGHSYTVVSTQKELLFVQQFDSENQTRHGVIEQLRDITSGVPVILNQAKTGSLFESLAH
ncbi:MAG: hypothetical protein LBD33_02250 [Puniceicoccales bacterium]|jgi:hypothetical protein|nr:hypothetical protein [Puniceicoccales bacterium]